MTSSSQDELELPEDAQHGVSRGCPVVMVISRPISGHVMNMRVFQPPAFYGVSEEHWTKATDLSLRLSAFELLG
jgi:hypothetical protein